MAEEIELKIEKKSKDIGKLGEGDKFFINGNGFVREIDGYYNQSLIVDGKKINIEDPLGASIKVFVDSLEGAGEPLVSHQRILKNVEMQEEIEKAYSG